MDSLSPYSSRWRPMLVADAMITAVNRYPRNDVRLLPILDTLALLIQRPLAFTFFRKNKSKRYERLTTTLSDPELQDSFQATLRNIEKTGAKLIPVPDTDIFLAVHEVKPQRKDGVLTANFPTLGNLRPFEVLLEILHTEESGLGKDVLGHIVQGLQNSGQPSKEHVSVHDNDEYWADRRRILGRVEPSSLIDLVRPVVNGALASISDSPLIKTLPGKQLPFDNLFFVLRSAANDRVRRRCFAYSAQVVLSENQKRAIESTLGKSFPSLVELPLGVDARAIADSVFHSGTVDFSDEKAGEGRDVPSEDKQSPDEKRQIAEAKVYGMITSDPHVFYVPIHVGGVPWLALFTVSPRNEETATWAHNYAVYRSLVSGVAENIRTLAKSTFLRLAKEAFLEEYRKQDQPSFTRRINDRWEELTLVFPYPTIRLLPQSKTLTGKSIILPGGLHAEIAITPNKWFPQHFEYDVLDEPSINQMLAEMLTEVEKEIRATRIEWEAQEHTIFNVLPTNQIEAALACDASELTGDARAFVEDARRKTLVLATSLSIPLPKRELKQLRNVNGVVKLLHWLEMNAFSGAKKAVLTVSTTGRDVGLYERAQLANAFTVLWNFWSNAAKTYPGARSSSYWITARWQDNALFISFKNAGQLPEYCIGYLSQADAPWSGPIDRKGLIIAKTKLQALNWQVNTVEVNGGFTTIGIVIPAEEASATSGQA